MPFIILWQSKKALTRCGLSILDFPSPRMVSQINRFKNKLSSLWSSFMAAEDRLRQSLRKVLRNWEWRVIPWIYQDESFGNRSGKAKGEVMVCARFLRVMNLTNFELIEMSCAVHRKRKVKNLKLKCQIWKSSINQVFYLWTSRIECIHMQIPSL